MSVGEHKLIGEIGDGDILVRSWRHVDESLGQNHVTHNVTIDMSHDDPEFSPSKTMTADEAIRLVGLLLEAVGHGYTRKLIPLREFVDIGFLQEANRQFFHPLGLALEIWQTDDGEIPCLGGIWDYRDDPEGMCFGKGVLDIEKAARVTVEREAHVPERIKLWGVVLQPFTDTSEPGVEP